MAGVGRLCLVAFLFTSSTWPAGAQTEQVFRLSPEAAQVASKLPYPPTFW